MTQQELSKFDGREGRQAYVAVGGTIYDLSSSRLWSDGLHEGVHQAGQDLTEELKSAPHVRAVIERFPIIGRLVESAAPHTDKSRLPLFTLLIGVLLLALLILLR